MPTKRDYLHTPVEHRLDVADLLVDVVCVVWGVSLLSGEAGMGKSRLVAEALTLAQSLRMQVLAGACQSYGTNSPYLVWQPIARLLVGIDANQPREGQLQQLDLALAAADPALLPRRSLLGPILNLAIPESDQTQALSPRERKVAREQLLLDFEGADGS